MTKDKVKALIYVLAIILLLTYTISLKWQLMKDEDPKVIQGTYQLSPTENKKDKPVEVIVVTDELTIYAYNQFEPLVKTSLKNREGHYYSFQWQGTKYLKFHNNGLVYIDNEKDHLYSINKIQDTPAFINVNKEEFKETP